MLWDGACVSVIWLRRFFECLGACKWKHGGYTIVSVRQQANMWLKINRDRTVFFVATSKLHLITANRKPFHLIFFSVTCPTLWLEVVINWVWIVAVGLGITWFDWLTDWESLLVDCQSTPRRILAQRKLQSPEDIECIWCGIVTVDIVAIVTP